MSRSCVAFSTVRLMVACSIAATSVAAFGCREQSPPKPGSAPAAEITPAKVTAARPQRKAIRRSITQPGQIEPFDLARLYAKIPAFVEAYRVDIGDHVKRGQLLADLSAPELGQELEQKKALVAQANAEVEQAQAAIKVAAAQQSSDEARVNEAIAAVDRVEAEFQRWNSEYDRVVKLVARSAVTEKLADETKSQMKAADAARKEASAHVESARAVAAASRAQVEKSMADEAAIRARRQVAEAEEARAAALVKYLKIEAPFDGVVSERNADIGRPRASDTCPVDAASRRPGSS